MSRIFVMGHGGAFARMMADLLVGAGHEVVPQPPTEAHSRGVFTVCEPMDFVRPDAYVKPSHRNDRAYLKRKKGRA